MDLENNFHDISVEDKPFSIVRQKVKKKKTRQFYYHNGLYAHGK